ncbi:Na+/H+ antiporter NhaA [Sulfurimonas sp.]|uniref:Na+/H+ antiporter NhaA n=1 Tax=Sulfurimonas sp. TaxID=2022749 RepID=UPI00345B5DD0
MCRCLSTLFSHKNRYFYRIVRFSKSIHHWINDGLMAIFFFIIKLEIKREISVPNQLGLSTRFIFL